MWNHFFFQEYFEIYVFFSTTTKIFNAGSIKINWVLSEISADGILDIIKILNFFYLESVAVKRLFC